MKYRPDLQNIEDLTDGLEPDPIPEIAYKAAMEIVHGNLFPSDCKKPTAEQVAKVISDTLDLPWLLSIRRLHESIEPPKEKED